MAFKVRLARSAQKQFAGLLPDAQTQVVTQLRNLEKRASLAKPILSGPAKGKMGFSIRIERLPLTEVITAVFRFTQDEEFIEVYSLVRAKGDPPNSQPPSEWMRNKDT